MSLSRCSLLACVLGALAPAVAGAAEFNMEIKSDDIHLGKSIMGTQLSNDDLKGRVVMIEFWGIN
jgi:hypothetical protein